MCICVRDLFLFLRESLGQNSCGCRTMIGWMRRKANERIEWKTTAKNWTHAGKNKYFLPNFNRCLLNLSYYYYYIYILLFCYCCRFSFLFPPSSSSSLFLCSVDLLLAVPDLVFYTYVLLFYSCCDSQINVAWFQNRETLFLKLYIDSCNLSSSSGSCACVHSTDYHSFLAPTCIARIYLYKQIA